jgi:hypothetical protein
LIEIFYGDIQLKVEVVMDMASTTPSTKEAAAKAETQRRRP